MFIHRWIKTNPKGSIAWLKGDLYAFVTAEHIANFLRRFGKLFKWTSGCLIHSAAILSKLLTQPPHTSTSPPSCHSLAWGSTFSRTNGCCRKEVQVPYNQIINTSVKTIWRLWNCVCHSLFSPLIFLLNASSTNIILSSAWDNQRFWHPSLGAVLEMLHFSMPVFTHMKGYSVSPETPGNIKSLLSKNEEAVIHAVIKSDPSGFAWTGCPEWEPYALSRLRLLSFCKKHTTHWSHLSSSSNVSKQPQELGYYLHILPPAMIIC